MPQNLSVHLLRQATGSVAFKIKRSVEKFRVQNVFHFIPVEFNPVIRATSLYLFTPLHALF